MWFMSIDKQRCFPVTQLVFGGSSVTMSGKFLVKMFFSCEERKSFMNEGTWPNTMTSGLDTRERNQQGEQELAFGSVSLLSVKPKFIRASNVRSSSWRYKKKTLTQTTSESVIFKSGGSVNQTESVLCCAECACLRLAADKLAAASFLG